MNDSNKKRNSSFRKLIPNIFLSKSKEKNTKDSQIKCKSPRDDSLNGNQYEKPKSIRPGNYENVDSCVYENLSTVYNIHPSHSKTFCSDPISNHSSSYTLVSGSIKNKQCKESQQIEVDCIYAARPQVPRRPLNENFPVIHDVTSRNISKFEKRQYPDVYYHSLEKISDNLASPHEEDLYKATQSSETPESVGAEIKKVSAKFLVSPKRESAVRTIQPNRARSLSFNNNPEKPRRNQYDKLNINLNNEHNKLSKPYNYSAPTSPILNNNKKPNMPNTVSPYEYVRKNIMEVEEKRNSLSRSSLRMKAPSPSLKIKMDKLQSTVISPNNKCEDINQKEKARKKVEAFYWKKLKELKQKEDEYYLRQSLNSAPLSPVKSCSYRNSNCSTPTSFVVEPRSRSLPRGRDLSYCMNQSIYSTAPFSRGAPERRTDTFVHTRNRYCDPDIVYKNPEKIVLAGRVPHLDSGTTYNAISPHRSLISENTQQSKRVSFEGENNKFDGNNEKRYMSTSEEINTTNKLLYSMTKTPPKPPVRTTSVGGTNFGYNYVGSKKMQQLFRALNSESESGSEAGEIQWILQRNEQKGCDIRDARLLSRHLRILE